MDNSPTPTMPTHVLVAGVWQPVDARPLALEDNWEIYFSDPAIVRDAEQTEYTYGLFDDQPRLPQKCRLTTFGSRFALQRVR
jgi:hypothetical protein